MGICTSTGIIRDFAGPYYVGQNQMAFGKPTRFLKLDPSEAEGRKWQSKMDFGKDMQGYDKA